MPDNNERNEMGHTAAEWDAAMREPLHPVEAMRGIAERIGEATGREVDHDAFDRARAYTDELVPVPGVYSPDQRTHSNVSAVDDGDDGPGGTVVMSDAFRDGCGLPQTERKGDWMQTFSGRQYWPLDPRADEVDVQDIAHHLSMLCRYCGACLQFWSVAEHSVGVLAVIEGDMRRNLRGVDFDHPFARKFRLAALLHDAPEAYCHDLIRPIKRCVHGYDQVEAANADAIAIALGLPLLSEIDASRIKLADNAMLLAEQEVLMAPAPAKWSPLNVPDAMVADARAFLARNRGTTCNPREAKALFLAEYTALAA